MYLVQKSITLLNISTVLLTILWPEFLDTSLIPEVFNQLTKAAQENPALIDDDDEEYLLPILFENSYVKKYNLKRIKNDENDKQIKLEFIETSASQPEKKRPQLKNARKMKNLHDALIGTNIGKKFMEIVDTGKCKFVEYLKAKFVPNHPRVANGYCIDKQKYYLYTFMHKDNYNECKRLKKMLFDTTESKRRAQILNELSSIMYVGITVNYMRRAFEHLIDHTHSFMKNVDKSRIPYDELVMQIYNPSDMGCTTHVDVLDLESMFVTLFQSIPLLNHSTFNKKKEALTRKHDPSTIIPMTLSAINEIIELNPVAIAVVENGKLIINDESMM